MSEQTVAVKAKKVASVTEELKNASSIVIINYRGLTVAEVTDLRKQLRDEGVKMEVIKNKVMDRAATDAGFEDLKPTFNGPTAVVFSSEDPVAGPKIVHNFAKANDKLKLKGGVIDGEVASLDEITAYAALPSREELLSTLANILQAPVRNFAYGVKAIADKKQSDDGDAA
ncbi:50S ribosomal protein L10 [Lentilactobacillus otakiensis]|uniref:Large ribosomal subunit protein uL10 n=1 Tax=Lentilactobacillus otakiensis DSM 19908 = JCM 15040 TaxID=1423780 RepID=S4NHH2_9LACO|nr:50S ribosomal protein L10 [Lentilactobacillus otakiensis]KRL09482.1 50S ribosomal protein L10 [Lentilactobacillus otakiensis DSM 19908 = JCM 15040]MBZ3775982.1 50S ribosomal protein L10 [Lentilactobacillus otakiensis]MDV3517592.1 50S ribosomal protein L10 [Lentilactobacillus otakiensis]GAD15506.1 50S ribosomal protein L10 [Lentilactobacillus otakiensis DSM 19908 = JCM 15040]